MDGQDNILLITNLLRVVIVQFLRDNYSSLKERLERQMKTNTSKIRESRTQMNMSVF